MCGELLPYITGGIQGNLERDSGELDPQLSQKLVHTNTSSSSSLENSQMERRVERVGYICLCMCVPVCTISVSVCIYTPCVCMCVCVCVCLCVPALLNAAPLHE